MSRITSLFPNVRQRVWFGSDSNAYVYGKDRMLIERLVPMPVEGEPVFARCGIGQGVESDAETEADDAEQARALRLAFTSIRRFGGGRIFVNKRIANNRRIPFLLQAFPDARFIEIVRDGRAVAYSLSRVDWWPDSFVWWYGGTPRQWAGVGRDPWELCAREWVEQARAIERGKMDVPADRVLQVKYESLLDSPVDGLRRMAGFGGLEHDPGWERHLRELEYANRNDTWRRRLDPSDAATIEGVQREMLVKYGYVL